MAATSWYLSNLSNGVWATYKGAELGRTKPFDQLTLTYAIADERAGAEVDVYLDAKVTKKTVEGTKIGTFVLAGTGGSEKMKSLTIPVKIDRPGVQHGHGSTAKGQLQTRQRAGQFGQADLWLRRRQALKLWPLGALLLGLQVSPCAPVQILGDAPAAPRRRRRGQPLWNRQTNRQSRRFGARFHGLGHERPRIAVCRCRSDCVCEVFSLPQ